ncbi:MAG: hypothetical protein SV253_07860 [Halobacteria archaeon]|nr:hypothetical protein [Halobacteria archaeon]
MSPTAKRRLNDDQKAILEYLKEVSEDGVVFLKSKEISREIDISPKKVGTNISRISDSEEVSIEKWSDSNATTWKVESESTSDSRHTS